MWKPSAIDDLRALEIKDHQLQYLSKVLFPQKKKKKPGTIGREVLRKENLGKGHYLNKPRAVTMPNISSVSSK